MCSLPRFSDSLFDDTLHSASDSSLNSSSNGLKDINDSVGWFTSAVCGYYKSNIKIAYLNINSIQNKLDEVKEMLNQSLFNLIYYLQHKLRSIAHFQVTCSHNLDIDILEEIVRKEQGV